MKNMKEFLTKLADLMEEYDIEFEATEDCGYDGCYASGIDIVQDASYGEGNQTRPFTTVSMGRDIDPENIRKEAFEL